MILFLSFNIIINGCYKNSNNPVNSRHLGNYMKINGFRIYYDFAPGDKSKPCLIFLHGWPHNSTMWQECSDYFRGKGYSTLLYDFRGTGRSEKKPGKSFYTLDNAEKDLTSIIDTLHIKDYYLLGHSFGSYTILSHLLKHNTKNVRGAILTNAGYQSPLKTLSNINLEKVKWLVFPVFNLYVKVYTTIFNRTKVFNFQGHKKKSTFILHAMGMSGSSYDSVTGYFYSMCNDIDFSSSLETISLPILVFGATKESILPMKNGKYIASHVQHGEFVEVIGDHTLMLKKSNILIPKIEDFIESN